jgi:pyrimidine deaminase RibD-like protein
MDEKWPEYMRMAVDAGKQSKAENGKSHPKVGAVLVKDGRVFGSAHRGELADGDHAEYTLFEKKLRDADLTGATLFTTLERCTSRKTHKPCSDWIIEKGISHVAIGILDPNPRIYLKGVSKLKERGISVSYFPMELRSEIQNDNKDFIGQFQANPLLEGRAVFDYARQNGFFTIGHSEFIFETHWSKGSDVAIHVYKDSSNIKSLGIALDAKNISEIIDAGIYDMSNRVETVEEGQFVVMKNINDNFAALHIVDIKDKSRGRPDNHNELTFDYWILTDKSCNFSAKRHFAVT